ncbi:hypothetical protein LMH73_015995 [Vibrio splendidus]|nr:hypothetical protein [Vibrio splendidus]MCC4880433.1 hypothetical protein [Vibrio splendidus]
MINESRNTAVRDAYFKACIGKGMFAFIKNDVRLKGSIVMIDTDGIVLEAQGKSQQVISWSAVASLSPDAHADHGSSDLILNLDELSKLSEAEESGVMKIQKRYFRSIRDLAEQRDANLIVCNYTVSGTPIKGTPLVCDDEVQLIRNTFGGLQLVRWDAVSTTNCEFAKQRS